MKNCEKNNKWDAYRRKVKMLINVVNRESHFFDVRTRENRLSGNVIDIVEDDPEVTNTVERLNQAKRDIRNMLKSISQENKDERQWSQLAEADDQGLVDIDQVMCSLCGQPDEEGNDILLCDHDGCWRAYHQRCCDPPEESPGEGDWFCRQCQCLDDWYVIISFKHTT